MFSVKGQIVNILYHFRVLLNSFKEKEEREDSKICQRG